VLRLATGAYALPGAPSDIVAARLGGGLLTCVSLAERMGLPLLRTPRGPHIAVPSDRRVVRGSALPPGTHVHWDAALVDGRRRRVSSEGAGSDAPWSRLAVPLDLALLHAIACLPFREVVALWDAAVNRGLVEVVDLDARRPARSGRLRFDAVRRAVDGRSQSIPETFLRLALRRAGLRVEPQPLVEGVGHVDLLVEDLVVVEADGYAYHQDRRAFAEDRRRDRQVAMLGLRSLRYTYHDVVDRTELCVLEVAELVRRMRITGR